MSDKDARRRVKVTPKKVVGGNPPDLTEAAQLAAAAAAEAAQEDVIRGEDAPSGGKAAGPPGTAPRTAPPAQPDFQSTGVVAGQSAYASLMMASQEARFDTRPSAEGWEEALGAAMRINAREVTQFSAPKDAKPDTSEQVTRLCRFVFCMFCGSSMDSADFKGITNVKDWDRFAEGLFAPGEQLQKAKKYQVDGADLAPMLEAGMIALVTCFSSVKRKIFANLDRETKGAAAKWARAQNIVISFLRSNYDDSSATTIMADIVLIATINAATYPLKQDRRFGRDVVDRCGKVMSFMTLKVFGSGDWPNPNLNNLVQTGFCIAGDDSKIPIAHILYPIYNKDTFEEDWMAPHKGSYGAAGLDFVEFMRACVNNKGNQEKYDRNNQDYAGFSEWREFLKMKSGKSLSLWGLFELWKTRYGSKSMTQYNAAGSTGRLAIE